MKRNRKKKDDSLRLMVPAMEMSIKESQVIRSLPPVSSREREIKKNISLIPLNCNNSTVVLAGNVVAERERTMAEHSVEWTDRKRFYADEIAKLKEQRDLVKDRLDKAKEKLTKTVERIKTLEDRFKDTWLMTHRLKLTNDGLRQKQYYLAFWMIPIFIILVIFLYVLCDGSSLFITFDSTFQNIAAMGLLMTVSAALGLELLPTIAGYVKSLIEHEEYMSDGNSDSSLNTDQANNKRMKNLKNWYWSIWGTYALLLSGITVYRLVTMNELLQPAGGGFFEDTSAASAAPGPKAIALVFLFLILNFMTSMVCYFLGKTFLYLKELETLREDEEKLEEENRRCAAAYRELTPRIWDLIKTKDHRAEERYAAERDQIRAYYNTLANAYKNQIFKKMASEAQVLIFDWHYKNWCAAETEKDTAAEPENIDVIANNIKKIKEAS